MDVQERSPQVGNLTGVRRGSVADIEDVPEEEMYFRAQRMTLEHEAQWLDEVARWLEPQGGMALYGNREGDAGMAALELRWAGELRALTAATLGRLNGQKGAAREWQDDAIARVYDAPGQDDTTVGVDTNPIDELCDELGVRRLVLFPSVLRRELPPGERVDALVELRRGKGRTARVERLEPLRNLLTEQLGRPVEMHLVDALRRVLRLPALLELGLLYGACLYFHERDGKR